MLRGYFWQASPVRQSAAGLPLQGARPTTLTASRVKMGRESHLRPLFAGRHKRRDLRRQRMASLVKLRRQRAAGSQHTRIVTLHLVYGKKSTCSYRVPAGRSFPLVHGVCATTFLPRIYLFPPRRPVFKVCPPSVRVHLGSFPHVLGFPRIAFVVPCFIGVIMEKSPRSCGNIPNAPRKLLIGRGANCRLIVSGPCSRVSAIVQMTARGELMTVWHVPAESPSVAHTVLNVQTAPIATREIR